MIARRQPQGRVRYGVVGLGHIVQSAVLPAFAHARSTSELAALVSGDPVKLQALGRKYGVAALYSYEDYERCLQEAGLDAVFIGLPNHLHREYSVRAARAGVHVLCEKPMAVTVEECEEMIRAAREGGVRLMIAYRLHFDGANLGAIEAVRSHQIGDPRVFTSTFTMQVAEGNIRLKKEGGGPLFDIGIYCVNAARYLFGAEPVEVSAFSANAGEPRFREVDDTVGVLLRFPQGRLAAFVCSFGATDLGEYRIVGTRGEIRLEPAYEYAEPLKRTLTVNGRRSVKSFPKRDQFAAELIHFSGCILQNHDPEPSGEEGLADVRIMQAVLQSIQTRAPVAVPVEAPPRRPSPEQEMRIPPVRKPRLVHASSPHPPGES